MATPTIQGSLRTRLAVQFKLVDAFSVYAQCESPQGESKTWWCSCHLNGFRELVSQQCLLALILKSTVCSTC